jgi:GDP-4-dehydro-6-deoxy-D-mannose reductase
VKRILVTGAGGFWGYHLAKHLLQKKYSVTGTCHRKKPSGLDTVDWIQLDVQNPSKIRAVVKRLRPDAVCHLAGQSSLSQSWKLRDKTFSLNTMSVFYFLSAIRDLSPKTRFVLASSIHVYGDLFRSGRLLNELDPARPEGPYGASKRLAELACLDFYGRFGLDSVILRPVNCIGSRLSADFAFSDWSRQVVAAEKNGNGTLEVGNLGVRRDFLHIEDGVEAFEKVMSRGKAGEIYNLSSQKVIPLKRYADFLTGLARVPVNIRVSKARFRRSDPPVTRVSSGKLRKLGWSPRRTAFEGLSDLLSEWRTRL